MKIAVSVEQMRKSDAYTIANLVPSAELMQRAGEGVFALYKWHGKTAVVCGSGNNAGDGYVLARLLFDAGFEVSIILLKDKFSPDGKMYFEQCTKRGIRYIYADENTDFDGYDIIVDCIFGTGFSGAVTGLAKEIIDKINFSGKEVVSVDINSGMNGDDGTFETCVKSHTTVSIGYLKTGFFVNRGVGVYDKLINCPIGIVLLGDACKVVEDGDEVDLPLGLPVTETDTFDPEQMMTLAKETGGVAVYQNAVCDGKNVFIFNKKEQMKKYGI